MQRLTSAHTAKAARLQARRKLQFNVPRVVRPATYPRWSTVDYGSPVPATPREASDLSEWARYVKTAVDKCGGNVSSLRQRSGVSRSSLYRWMNDDGTRVTIGKARQIAEAIGDDPRNAIRAAGALLDREDGSDPRLDGLDPRDPVVIQILEMKVSEGFRQQMFDYYRQKVELRRQADLKELEILASQDRGTSAA